MIFGLAISCGKRGIGVGGSLLDSHENMTGRWTEDIVPIASAKDFQLAMVTRQYAWCIQDGLLLVTV